jgi:hypothetical protein
MNEQQNTVIANAIVRMEAMIDELKEILAGEGIDTYIITDIEKYVSQSGNTTWKLYDAGGFIVTYIRQAHREFWEKLGHWDALNRLHEQSDYACEIIVETYREGDFNRISRVISFDIEIDTEDKEPFA